MSECTKIQDAAILKLGTGAISTRLAHDTDVYRMKTVELHHQLYHGSFFC